MDALLRGPEGRKTIVKDEKGRTIKTWDYTKPGIGAKVQLTIDARKQYLLENVLRRAGRAAGVVMDVNTGEVLAMASVPDYDPNAFIPSISSQRWKAYNSNKQLSPFSNRAISSFTPGSTMKIPTAIAGALQGHGQPRVLLRRLCGLWQSQDRLLDYGTSSKGSHGALTLSKAIQQSCNPYFNKLANTIGWQAMVDGCQMVGIGKRTGIELPKEDPGILPGSRAWRAANPGGRHDRRAHRLPLHRPGRHPRHPAPTLRHGRLRRQRRQILSARASSARPSPTKARCSSPTSRDGRRSDRSRHQTQRLRTHPPRHVDGRQRPRRHRRQGQNAPHGGRRQNRHRPDHGQRQEIQQLVGHQLRPLRKPEICHLRARPERRLRRRRLRPAGATSSTADCSPRTKG